MKFLSIVALAASASAFAPASLPSSVQSATSLFNNPDGYGKYDDKLWDNEAKKDVYASWDPNAPRSGSNFNPFETWEGNTPDASGKYPGESWYKDPQRGDVNFAQMMVEREEAEARAASPKAGDAPGSPGCRNAK
mmetsp:Transcript_6494/g.5333  ORF Transcript_6494/g.5333 Transcript_6494/m.5333 type:complete len:135 (-) Transcript_6494:144-548(-)